MIERKIKKIFIIINIILIVFGFYAIKNQILSTIDDFFYSKLFSSFVDKNNIKGYNKIALIKIDEKFFKKEGITLSTFHRGYYAKLIERLKKYGVKNIIFDVYFQDLKYGNGKNIAQKVYKKSIQYFDKQLAKNIDNSVVLGAIPSGSGNFIEAPSKNLLKKGAWLGSVKSHLNKKEINDGVYSYGIYSGEKIATLGYVAYLNRISNNKNYKLSFDKEKGTLSKLFKLDYLNISFNGKKIQIPLSTDYKQENFILTPIFIKNNIPRAYSIYDIIHDNDLIYQDKLKDKTVFIGATDQTLNDIKLSYVGMIPGVLYHMNNFLAINSKQFFYVLPVGQSFLILIVILLIGYIFVVLFKNEKLTFLVFAIFIFSLFISSYTLFLYGILFPIGTIIVIMSIKLVIDIIHILFINQEKKKFISNLFDKYVGNKIREEKEIRNSMDITTKNKEIALMFSDIASFTNISEKLKAEEVGKMLNTYFEVCGRYIKESNGYVDKYIGDAIMAYWEDINNVDHITKAVISIQKHHPEIIDKVEEKLGKRIDIKTRIGLHFGEAIVGDIGDMKTKIQPTAIGDNVNLASRLEGINKYYGTNIIVSEDFYNKIQNKDNFIIRKIDKITVKGKTEAVSIYEVQMYYLNEINNDIKSYINKFEEGLSLYFKGEFEKAKEIFENIEVLSYGKKDTVLKLFIDRINYLTKNPPQNWDGVWRYNTK